MSHFSVYRPVTVIMICIGIIVLGCISMQKTPVRLLPTIETRDFTVYTSMRGASSEEVEDQITSNLERAFSTLPGLEGTKSVSQREVSRIDLKFKANADTLEIMNLIREKADAAGLPEGASRPRVIKDSKKAGATMRLLVQPTSASNLSHIDDLVRLDFIRNLENIEGVALALASGSASPYIVVHLNTESLLFFNINPQQVATQLQLNNRFSSSGDIEIQGKKIAVKIGNQIESIEDLKNVLVGGTSEKPIRLGQIANIEREEVRPDVLQRLNGNEAINIEIFKEFESSAPQLSEKIRVVWEEFLQNHKHELSGAIITNEGLEIGNSIDGVIGAVVGGSLLTAFSIFVFMNSMTSTAIISAVIPIALFISLIMMYFYGLTYNLLSLAGMALGVGMLVDNAIVVLESIRALQSEIEDAKEAAVIGTDRVSSSIISSTLANVAVFGPLIFVDGVIGQLFKDISMTIVFSNIAALIAALLLVPMLAARFGIQSLQKASVSGPSTAFDVQPFNISEHGRGTIYIQAFQSLMFGAKIGMAFFFWKATIVLSSLKQQLNVAFQKILKAIDPFQNRLNQVVGHLENMIGRAIPFCMKIPAKTSMWIVSSIIVALIVLASLGSDLFPDSGATRFLYSLTFDQGMVLSLTEERLKHIEQQVSQLSGVESISITAGTSSSNVAEMVINTVEGLGPEINKKIATILDSSAGLEFRRIREDLIAQSKPVEVVVSSEDLKQLEVQAGIIFNRLTQLPELTDLESSIKPKAEEIQVQFNKAKLENLGLDANGFIFGLKSLLQDFDATSVRWKGEEIPLRLAKNTSYFKDINSIRYYYQNVDERNVYLEQVAQVEKHQIVSRIDRQNRKRVAIISANLQNSDLETANKIVSRELKKVAELKNANWTLRGQNEERKKSESSLTIAISLSILLIYLILASQFENFLQPALILIAIPLCLVGVAVLLPVFGLNISTMVFVGFIILVGSAVNTSIVLVDSANQLVKMGLSSSEAITKATIGRVRPILMSSGAGIIGLLPLALKLGSGSAMQQPLAITMIGGLLSSTILTLLWLPTLYAIVSAREK